MREELNGISDQVINRVDRVLVLPTEIDITDDIRNIEVEKYWFQNFLDSDLFEGSERILSSINFIEEKIRGTGTEIFICGSNANNLTKNRSIDILKDLDLWIVGRDIHPFELFGNDFLGENEKQSTIFDKQGKVRIEKYLLSGTSIFVKVACLVDSMLPYDISFFHGDQLLIDIYITQLRTDESGLIRFGLGNKKNDVLIAKTCEESMILDGGRMTVIGVNEIYKRLIMSK